MHAHDENNGEKHCRNCGAPLAGRSWHSVCSSCVLKQVMDEADPMEAEWAEGESALETDMEAALRAELKQRPRYRGEREYMRGGMGRILIARDAPMGREVVIKELSNGVVEAADKPHPAKRRKKSTPASVRFIREARITGQLEHPSIVPIYELGERENGDLYYTMKYVRGNSLSQALEKAGDLEGRLKLLPHVLDACQAIAYAHSRGVIHRDIKPANVMVGEFGETVLIDWGLARMKGEFEGRAAECDEEEMPAAAGAEGESQKTDHGEILGTPAYMAPEQASGNVNAVDERTDVYGLGVLLYVSLTGKAPYEGENRREILNKVTTSLPPPVRDLAPDAPVELTDICEKAMARDPRRRYLSAKQLAEELQQFLVGGWVTAHEYSLGERLSRFMDQYRGILATGAVALLLMVILGTSAVVRITKERNAAVEARQETQAYLERAVTNLDLANENLQLAKGAIDAILEEVDRDEIFLMTEGARVRRNLLVSALEYCKRFAEKSGEGNGESLAQIADIHYRLGDVYYNMGQYQEAIAAYNRAQDGFAAYMQNEPNRFEWAKIQLTEIASRLGEVYNSAGYYRKAVDAFIQVETDLKNLEAGTLNELQHRIDLAAVNLNLGSSYMEMGLAEEALPALRHARDTFAWIAENRPEYRYEEDSYGLALKSGPDFEDSIGLLAQCWHGLGSLHHRLGNLPEAKTAYRQALKCIQDKAEARPEIYEYQASIVETAHALGTVYEESGLRDEAIPVYKASLQAFEKGKILLNDIIEEEYSEGVTQQSAEGLAFRGSLAQMTTINASVHARLGNFQEALSGYDEAKEVLLALLEAQPDIPRYQAMLGDLWYCIGVVRHEQGASEEALAAWERAGELYANLSDNYPLVPKYRSELATIMGELGFLHTELGQSEEALKAFEQARVLNADLADSHPEIPQFQRDLALASLCKSYLYGKLGESDEMLAAARRAQETFAKFREAHPDAHVGNSGLASAWNHSQFARERLGQDEKVLDAYEQAGEIYTELTNHLPKVSEL